MSEMKGVLVIGKEWTPRKCPLTTSFVQKDFAIKLATRSHRVYFTVLSATDEEKEDAERKGVHLILPNPGRKTRNAEDDMLLLHKENFPDLKNYKPISVIFGHACENGTADAALVIKNDLFEDAVFIPFYYEIPEDTGLDPETLQEKADELMDYAEAAFAFVSVGTNTYNYNENMYKHLNKQKHFQYIPWVGVEFEKFEVPKTTVDKKIEVYSLHTVRNDQNLDSLEAAAIAMGKVAYFYKYDKFRPHWKIRGIPKECCGECKKFLNRKADSSILKINIYPPSLNKIKQDFQQCHLLAVFTTEGDPFGMVGLLGCAAGVPSLVSKSTGFASFIEAEFPDLHSVVCNIEPADTIERASTRWEEHIMKTLKNYDMARDTEQNLMTKLHKAAKDGIIAEFQTNLLNLVSKRLEDDQTKTPDEECKDTEEAGPNETNTSPEEVQEVVEDNSDQGQSNNGNNHNGDDRSSTHRQETKIGIVEVRITVSDCTPIADHGGTPPEEIKKIATSMLNEIRTPEDLPYVQEHLQSLGPISIRLIKEGSLCVVLDCETSECVEKLWVDYRRGILKSLFTDDIGTDERLKRYGVSTVSLKVSLPRWQYRRAVVQLKYLKEGYEPKEESSDLCPVCGKMATADTSVVLSESLREEDDITNFVAVEFESSIARFDRRKADLTRMLGGDGTSVIEIAIPKEERSNDVSSIILFKVKAPQQLSVFARERPEILGALGINRYLHLDIDQLSRVRSEGAVGESCHYVANELNTLVEESGVVLRPATSEMLARQRDEGLTERLFGILKSTQASPYLHAVTMVYDDHEIRQAIEQDYTALQNKYQTVKQNLKETVEEKDRLHKTIDEMTILESNRRPSVDTNIEEFSFKFDDTQQSYEEILHTLPCHFTWKLHVDVNFRYEYLMPAVEDMLKHHGDLAPVPIKALKGYLYVSKLRPKYKRDLKAALKWFDEALSDNQKELGRCDDNDGPLGDKLVILADIAWVHFLFGERERVGERLNEIANLFVGKLTEKGKSYIYGQKAVAFLYLWKGANDEGIDCLQRALLSFPKKIDWLVLLAFLLSLKRQRIFDDRKCNEASMMVYRIKHLAEKVLEINPNHGCAMAMLGRLYTDMGRYDDAKPHVERALKLHPTSPIILGEVLKFFIHREDYDGALNVVHNAIKHKPESPELTHMLGEIYVAKYLRHPSIESNSQLLPRALHCYDEAIKFAGGVFHHAVFATGRVLKLMKKHDETKEILTQLIDGGTLSCPFHKSWAYFDLACTYKLLNDDRKRQIYLNKAVNVGYEYRDGKKAARATIKMLEKRLEREGKNETVLRELGSMHMKLREFEKACEYHLEILNQ